MGVSADYEQRITSFLIEAGAQNVRIRKGKTHPRVVFEWKGEERFYVIAGTTGDSLRGAKNAIGDLRHMLGLVETVKRVGTRRIRKARAEKPAPECPTLTPTNDWTVKLYAAYRPEDLNKRLHEAFLSYWRQCMASVGGVSRI